MSYKRSLNLNKPRAFNIENTINAVLRIFVWINIALGEIQKAKQTIDAVPNQHPFEIKYHKIERIDWESCYKVLDNTERKRCLLKSW